MTVPSATLVKLTPWPVYALRQGTLVVSRPCIASVVAEGIPAVPTRWWSQESLTLAFRKLYPAHFFENFRFPMVEDIINAAPFTAFPMWLRDRAYIGTPSC